MPTLSLTLPVPLLPPSPSPTLFPGPRGNASRSRGKRRQLSWQGCQGHRRCHVPQAQFHQGCVPIPVRKRFWVWVRKRFWVWVCDQESVGLQPVSTQNIIVNTECHYKRGCKPAPTKFRRGPYQISEGANPHLPETMARKPPQMPQISEGSHANLTILTGLGSRATPKIKKLQTLFELQLKKRS